MKLQLAREPQGSTVRERGAQQSTVQGLGPRQSTVQGLGPRQSTVRVRKSVWWDPQHPSVGGAEYRG